MNYQINDENILINIIRKNNKNLYMRFKTSKMIEVTCNKYVSEKEILKILEKNRQGIEKMYYQKLKEEDNAKYFWYLGKKYNIILRESERNVFFDNDNIITKNEKMLDKFYRIECERVFLLEVERIAKYFLNIPKFSVKIRTMKTRWGVNNRKNNTITLNSELLKKDLDLLDYVIIHELCHFYEANHSSRFWQHVEKYYPKYKEARKRLRS